jgi:hypothetical protein
VILPFLLAAAIVAPQQSPAQTRIVPAATWVEPFFEMIDQVGARMKLKPLRSTGIRPGNLELRVWEGFGSGPFRGFIVRRVGGAWSAQSLLMRPPSKPRFVKIAKSGDWASAWDRLESAGLEEIKDDSEIPHCTIVTAGVRFVVEIAKAGYYRTYMVDNPQGMRSPDGDRFLRLLPILYEAFGEPPHLDFPPAKGELEIVASVSSTPDSDLVGRLRGVWMSVAGPVPGFAPDLVLPSQQGFAAGVNLQVPSCAGLPGAARSVHISGDVVVELLIDVQGGVLAARALSGPSDLEWPSVTIALNWKFAPLPGRRQIRSTVLTIRYRQEWAPFPWLK